MLNPPATIKVGPFDFKLEFHHDLGGSHSLRGNTSLDRLLIKVDATMAPVAQQCVVVHEVLHAALEMVGELPEDDCKQTEETWIQRVAPTLLMIIQQNPQLLDYLEDTDV